MTSTPNLALPYIDVGQAQKEVTHNEALTTIDVLAQATVINVTTTAPPGSPTDGQAWIVASVATGAWAGKEGQIAAWFSGWKFYPPKEGWIVWDQAQDKPLYYDGAAWQIIPAGVGATFRAADGTVSLPGITFDADPDTGIVRLGANDMGIVTGGVLRFRVDGSGVLRLVSGNLILGATGAGGVTLAGDYVGLKSDDGADRIRAGKLGGDNRIIIDLYDAAGASSVVIRDSAAATIFEIDSDGGVTAPGLPITSPGGGSNKLWVDTGSANVLKRA